MLLDSLHYAKSSITCVFSRIYHKKTTRNTAKSFRKLEYNIVYTTNNTHQAHLTNKTTHNTKKIKNKNTSTRVCKLKCNDCPKFYIGQMGRFFKTYKHIKHINI